MRGDGHPLGAAYAISESDINYCQEFGLVVKATYYLVKYRLGRLFPYRVRCFRSVPRVLTKSHHPLHGLPILPSYRYDLGIRCSRGPTRFLRLASYFLTLRLIQGHGFEATHFTNWFTAIRASPPAPHPHIVSMCTTTCPLRHWHWVFVLLRFRIPYPTMTTCTHKLVI